MKQGEKETKRGRDHGVKNTTRRRDNETMNQKDEETKRR